jgi:hypothetical protein
MTAIHGRNLGTYKGWEETGMIQRSVHNKVLRIPRCATNRIEEPALGRESEMGKILSLKLSIGERLGR